MKTIREIEGTHVYLWIAGRQAEVESGNAPPDSFRCVALTVEQARSLFDATNPVSHMAMNWARREHLHAGAGFSIWEDGQKVGWGHQPGQLRSQLKDIAGRQP